jgi:hypothetical protein
MISYASNTYGRRNLDALRAANWRVLLTPDKPRPPEGMRFGIDNGAWACFQQRIPFEDAPFKRLIERHGAAADFVVIPDIVCGGAQSLDFSLRWLEELRGIRRLLLAVQDGMSAPEIGAILRREPGLGIFLGGSTEWKLRTMYGWGMVANAFGCWYHVGRVNTRRRIRLCAEAGATSFDGTAATMYSINIPKLEAERRQASLLTPAAINGG